jgi:hypothetical protein
LSDKPGAADAGSEGPPPVVGGAASGESYDLLAEPTHRELEDDAGFLKGQKPAPIYRCYHCGRHTTRRVPIAFQSTGSPQGIFQFQWMAQCRACGQRHLAGETP